MIRPHLSLSGRNYITSAPIRLEFILPSDPYHLPQRIHLPRALHRQMTCQQLSSYTEQKDASSGSGMVFPECADKLEGRAALLFLLSSLGLASPLGVSGDWDGGGEGKRKD